MSLTDMLKDYDVVLDGTDNFSAKYAIGDACDRAGIPLVYGSIFQFEGQVSVFQLPTALHPHGISYRDVFPEAPPPGLSANCGEAGVIGVLPGIIGTMQANEVIKIITGLGKSLAGNLFLFDALSGTAQTLAIERRVGLPKGNASLEAEIEISRDDFVQLIESGDPPLLIDVRDESEHAANSLGGINIPLLKLHEQLHSIPLKGNVVVYCKSGVRSAKAALYLQRILKDVKVKSLQGGVDAWVCTVY